MLRRSWALQRPNQVAPGDGPFHGTHPRKVGMHRLVSNSDADACAPTKSSCPATLTSFGWLMSTIYLGRGSKRGGMVATQS